MNILRANILRISRAPSIIYFFTTLPYHPAIFHLNFVAVSAERLPINSSMIKTYMKMKKNILVPLMAAAITLGVPSSATAGDNPAWLKDALFYQIYPSSYMDSDGNGIGDLPGITSRLDYIKSLGVNAIWLNPVFESGWFDGGYDVIDFYKIDPRFGTNTDLVTLVNEAHKRGIKVCLDLVAGHTSDKCPWFTESANGDVNSRYADYYIWTDTISDKDKHDIELRHQAPNPESSNIGLYVEANAHRAKYYQKNFFECQPALNYGYAHPDPNHKWEQSVTAPGPQAVRRELRNIMAFWFGKGVDGFRVDMAHSLVKNDPDKAETSKLWREMRAWKDENFPDNVLISEWADPTVSIPAGFNIDFMMAFGVPGYGSLFFARDTPWGTPRYDDVFTYDYCYFDKAGKGSPKEFVKNYSNSYFKTRDLGYISIPTANHDYQRPNIGTRNTPDQLKVTMTFFLTMPGVPIIYYGDEIGMKYQMNLPSKEGSNERAGTRTPMQWTPGKTAGFSTCQPSKLYIPVDTENGKITVSTEEADPNSLLNYVKKLIQLRHATPALDNTGYWQMVSSEKQPYPWVYSRSADHALYYIALNPSGKKVTCKVSPKSGKLVLATGSASLQNGTLTMGAVSAAIFKMEL